MSAQAIYDDLVAALGIEAVEYNTGTKYLPRPSSAPRKSLHAPTPIHITSLQRLRHDYLGGP
jgi:hypothetical protein